MQNAMRRSVLAIVLGLSLAASGAMGQSAGAKAAVDSAKAAGVVGEQGDGFLGLVTGAAPPGVKSAVTEINTGRAKAYADIAAKTGVAVAVAGEATARQLQSRLPSGQYFKPEDGSWTRK
jgi:uncharacterized protein YdbL (DUF1318 family)